ncbi:hypothetical protein OIU76_008070 [Salix suchowensis]|nr:hypothetical protein OIU76_008070 [Salix suchowensis]
MPKLVLHEKKTKVKNNKKPIPNIKFKGNVLFYHYTFIFIFLKFNFRIGSKNPFP